jgi:enoyl-CoA hydratase/carnithine racemase
MTGHVRCETAEGVLTLALNRPERKNALTRAPNFARTPA